MRRIARLYWWHEAWALQAIVEKKFLVGFLRQETLIVWYAVPAALMTLSVVAYDAGGPFFWVLVSLSWLGFAWAAIGVFWLCYHIGYLADEIGASTTPTSDLTRAQKRLDRLKRNLGTA